MISSSSDALLRFTRSSDDAVIEVSHDSSNDQLNGTFTKNGKAVGGNFVTYTNYNKGDMRPDDTRAPERYCHQGYIEVNKTLRQQGISYVLAYAGAAYARTELGHTRVGTNSVNQNSGPLAKALGFKAIGEIQILSATTVMQQASVGMNKYGWLVTGGTLASTLGISSSSSITRTTTVSERSRLLDDDPPQSKWCCCFLTTACCRWRGLPDDCEELTLLRHYRDTYLRNSEAGSAAIERYYEIAPSIAAAIDRDRDARKIYDWIYEVIQRCLGAMQRADYDSVFEQYKQMVLELEQRYCTQR